MDARHVQRLSQIGLGVLLLIIIRTLGEVFRLQYVTGMPSRSRR